MFSESALQFQAPVIEYFNAQFLKTFDVHFIISIPNCYVKS